MPAGVRFLLSLRRLPPHIEELRGLWVRTGMRPSGEWLAPAACAFMLVSMSFLHHRKFQRGFNDIALVFDRVMLFDLAVLVLACLAAIAVGRRIQAADTVRSLVQQGVAAINVAEALPTVSMRAWAAVLAAHAAVDAVLFANADLLAGAPPAGGRGYPGTIPLVTNAAYAALSLAAAWSCLETVRFASAMLADGMLPSAQGWRLARRITLSILPRVFLLIVAWYLVAACIVIPIESHWDRWIRSYGDATVVSLAAVPGLLLAVWLKRAFSRSALLRFAARMAEWRERGLGEEPPTHEPLLVLLATRAVLVREEIADAEVTAGFPAGRLAALRRRLARLERASK